MSQEQRHAQQSRIIRERVRGLFQRGKEAAQANPVLRQAFEELAIALEALERVEAHARACEEQRLYEVETLEALNCHYRELFQQAPAGYLITSLEGTIRETNTTAAMLLHTPEQRLIGRSLTFFLPYGERRAFQYTLTQLQNAVHAQSWQQCFQTWDNLSVQVMVYVAMARGKSGQPQALRWLLYELPAGAQSMGLRISIAHEDHAKTPPTTLDTARS